VEEDLTTGAGGTAGLPTDHEHSASHGEDQSKDPAEQEALARDLGEELTDSFVRFIRGEMEFPDLTFLAYETLHDLFVVASGEYDVEYDEDDSSDDDDSNDDETVDEGANGGEIHESYDETAGTEEQEELAQEPAR